METLLPKRNLLAWKIAALLVIALTILAGKAFKDVSKISLACAFVAYAFFFVRLKIFDIRIVFLLCGASLSTSNEDLWNALCKMWERIPNEELGNVASKMWVWNRSYIAIMVAFGFAALLKYSGFVREFASIGSAFWTGTRSSAFALFFAALITFLVNAIILSANASCAIVAPIFIPLLVRLGFSAQVAAAAIVIGAWGGFLNQADAGGSAIARAIGDEQMYSIFGRHLLPAILALIAANITFAIMVGKPKSSSEGVKPSEEAEQTERIDINWTPIIIVLMPFLLLLPLELLAAGLRFQHRTNSNWYFSVENRLVLCLVLASIIASIAMTQKREHCVKNKWSLPKIFTGGMWKGFTEVVILIASAKIFISSLMHMLPKSVENPWIAMALVPLAFVTSAMLGSGDAIASTFIPFVVTALETHASTFDLKSITVVSIAASMLWLATEIGRSVSSVSAATMTCAREATAVEGDSVVVSRYARCPLLVGFVVGSAALYFVFRIF